MIEKSLYENYRIDFDDKLKPDSDDYLFVFNENRQLFLMMIRNYPQHWITSTLILHYILDNIMIKSIRRQCRKR